MTARFSVPLLIGASGGKSIRAHQSAAQLGDSQPGNLDTAIKNAHDALSRPVSRGHSADTIGRVLAIPPKRRPRNEICFLTDAEVTALLAAPDRTTRAGRRDHAMFQLAVTAGLRVGELTALQVRDVHLDVGAHVLCRGKGRKNRTTPLDRQTVQVLKAFTNEQPSQ